MLEPLGPSLLGGEDEASSADCPRACMQQAFLSHGSQCAVPPPVAGAQSPQKSVTIKEAGSRLCLFEFLSW
jgi:hypothetical protein